MDLALKEAISLIKELEQALYRPTPFGEALRIVIDTIERMPQPVPKPHGEINLTPTALKAVLDMIHDGQSVQAIKAVREETGCYLVDAQDYVDSLRK